MPEILGVSKSVSGFDPLSIVGCQLWLDANDISTFTFSSGSNILRWYDKSGYGRNATQRTAYLSTYSSNAFNGLPGVLFAGTSSTVQSNMVCSVPAGTFPNFLTCFVVFQRTGTAYTYEVPISRTSSTYGAPFDMWDNTRYIGNGSGYTQSNSSIDFRDRTGPNVFVFQVTATGPTWTEYFNGVPSVVTYSGNGSTGYSDVASSVYIGGRGDSVTLFDGTISEVIMYNTILNTAQRQQVEGYLSWKWKISQLPSIDQLPNPIFSPLTIPNCKLWLDAADSSKVSVSGTTVTGITDKSPNATVLTSPAGFTYPNNTFNGAYPSFYNTNASGGRLGYNSGFTLGGQVTVFIVGQITSPSAGNQFFDFIDGYGSTNRFFLFTSPNNLSVYAYASSSGGSEQVSGTVTTAQMTTPFCWCVSSDTSTTSGVVQHYLNGITLAQSSSARFAITSFTGVVIAQRYTQGAESVVGHIAEYIIYNSLLTTAQRQTVENYLMSKWAIASVVPHPFALYPSLTRAFTPLDVAGCSLWLDGNDQSSMTFSGSTITQWRDKSGNGYHANIYSGRVGATLVGYVPGNGYWNTSRGTATNAVNFQGSTVGYQTSYPANPTTETMFIVANVTSPSINNNTIIGGQVGARSFGFGYSGTTGAAGTGVSSYLTNEVAWQTTNISGTPGGYTHIITGYSAYSSITGTLVGVALNGGSFTTGSISNFSNGTTTTLGVDTTNSGYYFVGSVMEIIFYNSVLINAASNGNHARQQIEGYLAAKWGLQFNLPGIPLSPYDPGIYGYKMALWLDGADQTTMTGTTTLTAWRDKSPYGFVANSFSNSVAAPSWVANVQNGKGAVQYSTGNGSSITNFNAFQSAYTGYITVFEVYYAINQAVSGPFVELSVNENSNTGFYLYSAGGQNFAYNPGTGQVPTNFGNVTVSNTWQLIEGNTYDTSLTGSQISFYLNGVLKSSATTGAALPFFTSNLYINGRGGANNTSYNAYLGELIVYNYNLSGPERKTVENYLMNKWGISNITQHAFKNVPPSTVAQFSPISIAGAQLWMDASVDGNADGTTITSIPDLSGKATNLNAIGTITLQKVGRNGLSVYNFAGNRASNAAFSWGTSFTHFVVAASGSGNWLNSVGSGAANLTTYVGPGNWAFINVNAATNFVDPGAITTWTISPSGSSTGINDGRQYVTLPAPTGSSTVTSTYTVPISATRDTSFTFFLPSTAGQYSYFGLRCASPANEIKFLLNTLSGAPSNVYFFLSPNPAVAVSAGQIVSCKVTNTTVTLYNYSSGSNQSVSWTNTGGNWAMFFEVIGNGTGANTTTYSYIGFDPGLGQSIFSRNGSGLRSDWNMMSVGYTSGSTTMTNYTVNGNVRSSTTNTAITSTTPTLPLYINGSSTGAYDYTYFAEIIHYNVSLTSAQRQAVEGYLAWKWGLNAYLPTTHPFFKFPPGNLAY